MGLDDRVVMGPRGSAGGKVVRVEDGLLGCVSMVV